MTASVCGTTPNPINSYTTSLDSTTRSAPDLRVCPFPDRARSRQMVASATDRGGRAERLDDGLPGPGRIWEPGQVLVRFSRGVPPDVRRCMGKYVSTRVLDDDPFLSRVVLLRVRSGVPVMTAVRKLRSQPDYVSWVTPNFVTETEADKGVTDDPLYPAFDWNKTLDATKFNKQWYLQSGAVRQGGRWRYVGIGAIDAWRRTGFTGNPQFRLGVIDPGVEGGSWESQSDFVAEPRFWSKKTNFAGLSATIAEKADGTLDVQSTDKWPGPKTIGDTAVHGTQAAWLAAGFGNNGRGGSGVMQRAAIVPVKADNLAATLRGMEWIAMTGQARVVNLSISAGGLQLPTPLTEKALFFAQQDINRQFQDVMAKHQDVLWVFSANNTAFNLDIPGTFKRDGSDAALPLTTVFNGGRYRVDEPGLIPALFTPAQWNAQFPRKTSVSTVSPCSLRTIARPDGHPFTEYGPFGGERGNMICVAATDISGQLADFSSYGRHTVEFAAPGERIVVPRSGADAGKYSLVDGTSFSAPLVAGVAGLVMAKYPVLDTRSVKCVLMLAASRAPLPDQSVTNPKHPAMLQHDDVVKAMPVLSEADRDEGVHHRLGPDELMRVMGIPNADFALQIADRTVLEMKSGVALSADSCAPPPGPVIDTRVAYQNGKVLIDWQVKGPVNVDRLYVRPDWGEGKGIWHFESGGMRPGEVQRHPAVRPRLTASRSLLEEQDAGRPLLPGRRFPSDPDHRGGDQPRRHRRPLAEAAGLTRR